MHACRSVSPDVLAAATGSWTHAATSSVDRKKTSLSFYTSSLDIMRIFSVTKIIVYNGGMSVC